jgi:serine phosphatase RsbU (regulator of sigma subunit)/anti-sigma regulatory factor (Ser/Thr protein kinase)
MGVARDADRRHRNARREEARVETANLTDLAAAERLRRVLRVTDVALAHLSPEDLLDELLIRVREILDADTAAVLLLERPTGDLVARAAKGLEEEVEQGVRIPMGKGFAGRVAASRKPVVIGRVDHRNVLNPILREKGVRSLLGVPLLVRGEVLGVIHVGTLVERQFTEHDVELLQLVAERAALALHVRLYERERLVAETLQRTFLPETLPAVPGLRLASRYLPASSTASIGGDWYDVFVLPSGAIALAIGDVAGHGLHAASVMGRIRNALRAYSVEVADPGEVLRRLDRLMRFFEVEDIVTLLFGVVEADLSAFRYAAAGHLPPLVVTRDRGRFAGDGRADPPLGTEHSQTFREEVVPLEPGDSLLLYTDGLIERREESLTDGLERLRESAASVWDVRDPDEAIAAVLQTVVGERPPSDDIALLLLQREEASSTVDVRIPAERRELVTVRRALQRWLSDLDGSPVRGDVITAVGEACANAVEHAYGPAGGPIHVLGIRDNGTIQVTVRDQGRWRERRPHRGRGISLMRAVMDTVEVDPSAAGTTVVMRRAVSEG